MRATRSIATALCNGPALIWLAMLILACSPAHAATDEVTLRWTSPGDNGTVGRANVYEIRYSTTAPDTDTLAWWGAATEVEQFLIPQMFGQAESLVVAGLAPDTEIFFALRAIDEAGNTSPISNIVSKTTDPAPLDSLPPIISAVAVAELGSDAATIEWETDEPAAGQIRYGVDGDLSLQTPIEPVAVMSHSVSLSGLSAGTDYSFLITAADGAQNEAQAGPFAFQTSSPPDTTPPAIIELTLVALSSAEALLSFGTDEPAESWVEYGTTSDYGSATEPAGFLTVEHEITLGELEPESEYHFRVVARDGAGNVGATGDLTFVTPPSDQGDDSTPPAVAGVQATVESASAVRVRWSTDEPTTGELLYQLAAGGPEYTAFDTISVIEHEILLSGLASETEFSFRLVARDAAGNLTLWGPGIFGTPSSDDLIAPVISEVEIEPLSTDSVRVRWVTDEPSDSQVEYGVSPSRNLATPLDTARVTSHVVLLSSLQAGTSYRYQPLSRDASGNLGRGPDLTFIAPGGAGADTTAPIASGIEVVVLATDRVLIRWTTDEPAVGQVAYGLEMNRSSLSAPETEYSSSHELTLEGLADGKEWSFAVVSYDAAGNRSESAPANFATPSADDRTPPVISGIGVFGTTAISATIAWDTDELADGQIEYGTSDAYGIATPLDDSLRTSHSVRLQLLTPGTTYHFRILSRDGAGNVARSDDAIFATVPVQPLPGDSLAPVISQIVAVSDEPGVASIGWLTNEPSASQVEYGLTDSYGSASQRGFEYATEHAVLLAGLTPGTTFHFRVVAVDSSGNTAYSDDGIFQTFADLTPPASPSAVAAMPTETGYFIEWSRSDDPEVVGYRVYRSVGGPYELLNETPIAENSIVDNELMQSITDITYAVAAVDGAGNESAWALLSLSLRLALLPNSPNPFTATTVVRFRVPAMEPGRTLRTDLSVYNAAGALVRTLYSGQALSGEYEVVWHGDDWRGERVANGTYFLKLSAGRSNIVRKATLLR